MRSNRAMGCVPQPSFFPSPTTCLPFRLLTGALLLAAIPQLLRAQPEFFLKDGDTVVFYGDSITERRIYTSFVEAYVLTRFPKLNLKFVSSGWAGDTVAGGAGGPLEVRLQRDVIAYQPTVVTILLGMNDGRYRPLDEDTYHGFTAGYEKLVLILKAALPNARLILLEPSPHDDVTRSAQFPGGYNLVLKRFGQFIRTLGQRENLGVVDFNAAVIEPLAAINAKDPSAATAFIPDRIHPGPAASLLMAGALLKSWNAPAIVTEVAIDAESGTASQTVRTQVHTISRTGGTLSWTQNDVALPFPVDWLDAPLSVAAYSSDFIPALDDQPLRVRNLKRGDYTLKIDGQEIATYAADQFARGINLSQFETPMLRQASQVLKLTYQHNDLHVSRWRVVEVPLARYGLPHYDAAIEALDMLEQETIARQRATAQPKPHFYEIMPKEIGINRH
jgi:lysophospholipase L1-like esterase